MRIKKSLYNLVFGTYRSIRYYIVSKFPCHMPAPHPTEPIDVVIPVVAKDLDILPTCLEGLRRNFNNVMGEIYLVAPSDDRIVSFAQRHGVHFVAETSVLGFDKSYINYIDRNGNDRSGWIFQQLLKLSGGVGRNRYFITIDADHILLMPHTFLDTNGKTVFYMSKEHYYPYYETTAKILHHYPYASLSYVSHKMLFDKQCLNKLKDTIEKTRPGAKWYDILISVLKRNRNYSLSEFEIYGYTHSNKVRVLWREKELSKVTGTTYDYDTLKAQYHKAMSVTFPDYRKQK